MQKFQTSPNIKSDRQIAERQIYTMKTIRTERQSELDNSRYNSQKSQYQTNAFQKQEEKKDVRKNNVYQTTKNNQLEKEAFSKNTKQTRTKLVAERIYQKKLEDQQKEFIKLITLCICVIITVVAIFHKKEPDQIQSLF